ncbi:F-box/LRR-repeat protein 6 [Lamellibrachia satsuma]|nr:F-box/LRR-repeat protein 6 [Lamellibrachia satsuma]
MQISIFNALGFVQELPPIVVTIETTCRDTDAVADTETTARPHILMTGKLPPRGILGVRKDPKKQILFSFKTREGEEWPDSDSDDSDYLPSDDASTPRNNHHQDVGKKHSVSTSDSSRRKHQRRGTCLSTVVKSGSSAVENSGFWGETVPPELLLKIFEHVVDTSGSLPFLCRAAKVCRLWHRTACHPRLWKKVDLSYGWVKSTEATLSWLSENRLSRTTDINLSTWKSLTLTGFQYLCSILTAHCHMLRAINLSYCVKLTSAAIRLLADRCPNLTSVDLSSLQTDAVSCQCLTYLVEKVGQSLTQFNVSGNTLTGFTSVLKAMSDKCPNLEVLEISNARFSTDVLLLNIPKMQSGFQRMRVLRFANSKVAMSEVSARKMEESTGFPALEELSLAWGGETSNRGVNDHFLSRILKTSHGLHLLDIRGCVNLSTECLADIPVTDLCYLHISRSSVGRDGGLRTIISKWRHSLQELDLSWNQYPDTSLDLAVKRLGENSKTCPLTSVDLTGVSLSCSTIRTLLTGCPKLTSLNLTSCRGMPRGKKRLYTGLHLNQLRRDVVNMVDID